MLNTKPISDADKSQWRIWTNNVIDLKRWMAGTLKVFKTNVKISHPSSNMVMYVEESDKEEEEEEEKEEEVVPGEFIEIGTLEAAQEKMILENITEDMKTVLKDIWKLFDQIYAGLGTCGHLGGADGSPNDAALLFFISHFLQILKPGDVGVDFGSGNGATALTIACLGGFPMVCFEVIIYLLLFDTTSPKLFCFL